MYLDEDAIFLATTLFRQRGGGCYSCCLKVRLPEGGKPVCHVLLFYRGGQDAQQSLYLPLLVGDTSGKINPALATEVPSVANGDVSADLKTWTYKIRPGVVWTDGQPVDARDVDFTWKLWNNPKFGAATTTGYNLITSADLSSDNLKITFHLSQPFVAFNSVWTDGLTAPMPAHHFSSMTPDAVQKSPDHLNPTVTDGPFMMKESVPGDHFTVVRNPKYYRASEGLPYLVQVVS